MQTAIKCILAASAVSILAACGVGSDSNQLFAGNAEGFWRGTSSTGYEVSLAILENGETWGIYTNGTAIYGALYGRSTGTGTIFSASGSDFNLLNWSVTSGSYSGTVMARSTIQAVSNRGTSVSLAYDRSYDNAASLAAVAGNYTVSGVSASGSASSVPMSINSGGLVTVTGMTGCSASGAVVPRASGKNIYNIAMTFTGSNCALGNGGTASGILVLDQSVTPNIALSLALTPNKQDGFIAVGSKN